MEPDEAKEAFAMLDEHSNGQVTLKQLRESIVSIYQACALLRLPGARGICCQSTLAAMKQGLKGFEVVRR